MYNACMCAKYRFVCSVCVFKMSYHSSLCYYYYYIINLFFIYLIFLIHFFENKIQNTFTAYVNQSVVNCK